MLAWLKRGELGGACGRPVVVETVNERYGRANEGRNIRYVMYGQFAGFSNFSTVRCFFHLRSMAMSGAFCSLGERRIARQSLYGQLDTARYTGRS